MRELLSTFLEETHHAPHRCSFVVNGKLLAFDKGSSAEFATARKLLEKMQPQALDDANAKSRTGATERRTKTPGHTRPHYVIDVAVVDVFGRREKHLYHLNKLTQCLALTRSGPNGMPLSVELLDRIMSFLEPAELWCCCRYYANNRLRYDRNSRLR